MAVDKIPEPVAPTDGMVRIGVHAAGIGFVDTLVTRGLYQVRQEPPFTPGMEVAGVVVGTAGVRAQRRQNGCTPPCRSAAAPKRSGRRRIWSPHCLLR